MLNLVNIVKEVGRKIAEDRINAINSEIKWNITESQRLVKAYNEAICDADVTATYWYEQELKEKEHRIDMLKRKLA